MFGQTWSKLRCTFFKEHCCDLVGSTFFVFVDCWKSICHSLNLKFDYGELRDTAGNTKFAGGFKMEQAEKAANVVFRTANC